MAQVTDRLEEERWQRLIAQRLLRHEVRTGLIRTLTGLSEGRIRALFREIGGGEQTAPRHRGKTPFLVTFLWRNDTIREAAALFVCLWRREVEVLKLEPAQAGLTERLRLAQGFCDTYDLYEQIWPDPPLTLERAYSLVRALKAQQEVREEPCGECGALWLVNALALPGERCSHCKALERQALQQARARKGAKASRSISPRSSPLQQSLFTGEALEA